MFDFDGNESISKDEMIILCQSFFRGFRCVTDTRLISLDICKSLAEIIFENADIEHNGLICLNDLYSWIDDNQEIKSIFENSQLKTNRKSTVKKKTIKLTDAIYRTETKHNRNQSYMNSSRNNKTVIIPFKSPRKQSLILPKRKKQFIVAERNVNYTKDYAQSLYSIFNKFEINSKVPVKSN